MQAKPRQLSLVEIVDKGYIRSWRDGRVEHTVCSHRVRWIVKLAIVDIRRPRNVEQVRLPEGNFESVTLIRS